MGKYIAVDGGGTKTEAVIFDQKGMLYGKYQCQGTNPLFMEATVAIENLVEAISRVLAKSTFRIEQIDKIYVFVPGMTKYHDQIKTLFGENVVVYGDEYAAFYAALGKGVGITVLSGTGSFAVARKSNGQWISIGGWGPIFGDEGSGYCIGIDCLNAVTNQYDCEETVTILGQRVMEYFKIQSLEELKTIQNTEKFNRSAIAGLCKIVVQCAKDDDMLAQKILKDAAYQLACLVKKVILRIGLKEDYSYSLVGGVAQIGDFIEQPFTDYVKAWYPSSVYVKAKFAPVIGGVLYALDDLEIGGETVAPTKIQENYECL